MLEIDYELWILDAEKSPSPGKFCFYPLSKTEDGQHGAIPQLAFYGPHPPHENVKIAGIIYEGADPAWFDRWLDENEPFLSKLQFVNLNADSYYRP